jgi:hypothetical protein
VARISFSKDFRNRITEHNTSHVRLDHFPLTLFFGQFTWQFLNVKRRSSNILHLYQPFNSNFISWRVTVLFHPNSVNLKQESQSSRPREKGHTVNSLHYATTATCSPHGPNRQTNRSKITFHHMPDYSVRWTWKSSYGFVRKESRQQLVGDQIMNTFLPRKHPPAGELLQYAVSSRGAPTSKVKLWSCISQHATL